MAQEITVNLKLEPTPPKNPLEKYVSEIASDPEDQTFFSMSGSDIRKYLSRIIISNDGFRISPGFLSPGFGSNTTDNAEIAPSDLGNNDGVIKHELHHALHMFACARLFEDERYQNDAVLLFKDNILTDEKFKLWIEKNSNEEGKKHFAEIQSLMSSNPTSGEIISHATVIGAITYQHAFYLDPGIIEAIGSLEDSDAFLVVNGFLNRNLGLLIPGKQYLEGYGNKDYQQLVRQAGPIKMAMMTTPSHYTETNWRNYWLEDHK